MMRLGRQDKPERPYQVGVEKGALGYSAAWCLDMPGCYALIPPDGDTADRTSLAILEFTAWGHHRSAERVTVEPAQLQVVQTINSGAELHRGQTTAFFVHDGEAPRPGEFPLWANAHDLAVDELRDLALSLPAALQRHRLDHESKTILQIVQHTAATERALTMALRPGTATPNTPSTGHEESAFRDLQEAHTFLQQVVCDVPGDLRLRPTGDMEVGTEDWSVRKVMRRSIWHLRFHTWEIRNTLGGLFLA